MAGGDVETDPRDITLLGGKEAEGVVVVRGGGVTSKHPN